MKKTERALALLIFSSCSFIGAEDVRRVFLADYLPSELEIYHSRSFELPEKGVSYQTVRTSSSKGTSYVLQKQVASPKGEAPQPPTEKSWSEETYRNFALLNLDDKDKRTVTAKPYEWQGHIYTFRFHNKDLKDLVTIEVIVDSNEFYFSPTFCGREITNNQLFAPDALKKLGIHHLVQLLYSYGYTFPLSLSFFE